MGISRNTVRSALRGPLEDLSRRPHRIRNTIPEEEKNIIIKEAKRTGFGYVRLKNYIEKVYGKEISEGRIHYVLIRYAGNYRKKKKLKMGV